MTFRAREIRAPCDLNAPPLARAVIVAALMSPMF
jgi:hypothetical protein